MPFGISTLPKNMGGLESAHTNILVIARWHCVVNGVTAVG